MPAPWGKFDRVTGKSHHLIHHSADVAALFHELLLLPGMRAQLNAVWQLLSPLWAVRQFQRGKAWRFEGRR